MASASTRTSAALSGEVDKRVAAVYDTLHLQIKGLQVRACFHRCWPAIACLQLMWPRTAWLQLMLFLECQRGHNDVVCNG